MSRNWRSRWDWISRFFFLSRKAPSVFLTFAFSQHRPLKSISTHAFGAAGRISPRISLVYFPAKKRHNCLGLARRDSSPIDCSITKAAPGRNRCKHLLSSGLSTPSAARCHFPYVNSAFMSKSDSLLTLCASLMRNRWGRRFYISCRPRGKSAVINCYCGGEMAPSDVTSAPEHCYPDYLYMKRYRRIYYWQNKI